jgi:hypothetical protein
MENLNLSEENPSAIIYEKILSFGEILMGVEFSDEKTDNAVKVKHMFAEIANILKDEYSNNQKSPVKSLLFDHAIGEIVNAQMSIVKVIKMK